MWHKVFTSLAWSDIYAALAFLAAFTLAGYLLYFFIKKIVKRLTAKSGTTLDNTILEYLEKPLFVALGIFGLYVALLFLPFTEAVDRWISRVDQAVFAIIGIYAVIRVVDAILKWYSIEVAAKTRSSLDDKLVAVLRVGIPIIAGLLGAVMLLEIFGLPVEPIKAWLVKHLGRVILIIIISIVALFVLGSGVPKMVQIAMGRGRSEETSEEVKKRGDTLSGVLVTTGQVLITVVATFMLLSELGVNIAPVLAGAGIAGVAIAFGAQSLIKDIISGIFIIWDNQYRVGDVAKIADTAGLVEEINLRRTVLRDMDGVVHYIPNGEIKVASNFTRGRSRVNMNISVAYGEDLDRVIAVINRVGKELAADPAWAPFILTPPQVLRVDNLGDSGIDIKILGDTKPIKQWDIMGELRLRLKRTFDKEGIEMPWPHIKLYFGNSPPTGGPTESAKGSQPDNVGKT